MPICHGCYPPWRPLPSTPAPARRVGSHASAAPPKGACGADLGRRRTSRMRPPRHLLEAPRIERKRAKMPSTLKLWKRLPITRREAALGGGFCVPGASGAEAVTPRLEMGATKPPSVLEVGEFRCRERLRQCGASAGGIRAAKTLKSGQGNLCVLEFHASNVLHETSMKARRGSPVATWLGAQEHRQI